MASFLYPRIIIPDRGWRNIDNSFLAPTGKELFPGFFGSFPLSSLSQRLLVEPQYSHLRGKLGMFEPFVLTWRQFGEESLLRCYQGGLFMFVHSWIRDYMRIWANLFVMPILGCFKRWREGKPIVPVVIAKGKSIKEGVTSNNCKDLSGVSSTSGEWNKLSDPNSNSSSSDVINPVNESENSETSRNKPVSGMSIWTPDIFNRNVWSSNRSPITSPRSSRSPPRSPRSPPSRIINAKKSDDSNENSRNSKDILTTDTYSKIIATPPPHNGFNGLQKMLSELEDPYINLVDNIKSGKVIKQVVSIDPKEIEKCSLAKLSGFGGSSSSSSNNYTSTNTSNNYTSTNNSSTIIAGVGKNNSLIDLIWLSPQFPTDFLRFCIKIVTEFLTYPLLTLSNRAIFWDYRIIKNYIEFWQLWKKSFDIFGTVILYDGIVLHIGTTIAETLIQKFIDYSINSKCKNWDTIDQMAIRIMSVAFFGQLLTPFQQVSQIRRGECSYFLLANKDAILRGDALQLPPRLTLNCLLSRLSWQTVLFQLGFTTIICATNYSLLHWMHELKEEGDKDKKDV